MIELTYWYMFPVSIIVATIAMAAGIGGSVLFSPIFFLLLKLKPDIAIGTGIFIEIFGFGSGFIGYARKKLIDYKLGKQILLFAIPLVIVGVVLGKKIPSNILQLIFGIAIIILALSMISKEKKIMTKHHKFHTVHFHLGMWRKHYKLEHNKESIYFLSSLGGLFLGLVSSGLGEINEYNFIKKMKMKTAIASGTSVFIVIVSALTASVSHFIYFFTHLDSELISQVLSIIVFAVPGVVIGAQIGVKVSQKINTDHMKKFLFALFLLIGIFSITKLFL